MSASPDQARDAAILLAGGQSLRMAGQTKDKLLHPIHGVPLFRYALDSFTDRPTLHWIIIVHRDDALKAAMTASLPEDLLKSDRLHWTPGGPTRRDSVARGLDAVPSTARLVFIHDLARPLVSMESLEKLTHLALRDGAAGLAHRVTDTIKQTDTPVRKPDRIHPVDLERGRLWATETPQVFQRELITHAYRNILDQDLPITDDLAAVSALGHPVSLLENPHPNPKLTTPRDLPYLRFLLQPAE